MANIALSGTWTERTRSPLWDRLASRLRIHLRARRIDRVHRARLRLIRAEMRDPRWFADIGIDPRAARPADWVGEMARGMGGRL